MRKSYHERKLRKIQIRQITEIAGVVACIALGIGMGLFAATFM